MALKQKFFILVIDIFLKYVKLNLFNIVGNSGNLNLVYISSKKI